jgi:hypothetical protein
MADQDDAEARRQVAFREFDAFAREFKHAAPNGDSRSNLVTFETALVQMHRLYAAGQLTWKEFVGWLTENGRARG